MKPSLGISESSSVIAAILELVSISILLLATKSTKTSSISYIALAFMAGKLIIENFKALCHVDVSDSYDIIGFNVQEANEDFFQVFLNSFFLIQFLLRFY